MLNVRVVCPFVAQELKRFNCENAEKTIGLPREAILAICFSNSAAQPGNADESDTFVHARMPPALAG